ncbi:MAG: hypothetical protein EON59_05815 [Alphaproteobacteria bacterium]|nr:MAG: hypothetical protein EON59_05815 [Alphaproteobacteria bacterium]
MSELPPLVDLDDATMRVLSLPFGALCASTEDTAAYRGGMPAASLELGAANLILGATCCDRPVFSNVISRISGRRGRDVLLARTGFHPEILNPVTVDVALFAGRDVLLMEGLAFFRSSVGGLWLVSPCDLPFVEVGPGGLRLDMEPPFTGPDERSDGLCRAAAEIVRLGRTGGR